MNPAAADDRRWRQMRQALLALVLLASLAVLLLAARDIKAVMQSYLAAFLFWMGIPLGSLGWLLLHALTGGRWGEVIRPQLQGLAALLPWLVLGWLPIALSARWLYPWAAGTVAVGDRAVYLNELGFHVRAGVLLLLFLLLWALVRWFSDSVRSYWAGPGMIAFVLAITFAGVDWAMTLTPLWSSSIYGLLFLVNAGTSSLAAAVLLRLARRGPADVPLPMDADRLHDLGNLLLMMVALWAYVNFSQFLIVWSGNLPEEARWYLQRQGGWTWASVLLMVAHFALPLALLLLRGNKRQAEPVRAIAALLLVMQATHTAWLVIPSLGREGAQLRWHDPVMSLVFGVLLALCTRTAEGDAEQERGQVEGQGVAR